MNKTLLNILVKYLYPSVFSKTLDLEEIRIRYITFRAAFLINNSILSYNDLNVSPVDCNILVKLIMFLVALNPTRIQLMLL